ncbi:hypothetical protein TNCV_4830231 [Trichonephila clavipes]|nr:hypothetical protein TNCV_4830231 [Trichonephila clavipes]
MTVLEFDCYKVKKSNPLVHLWPGCKLSPGVAWTDKVLGWCPAEFHAKLSPAVGLNRQHSGIVVIAFP